MKTPSLRLLAASFATSSVLLTATAVASSLPQVATAPNIAELATVEVTGSRTADAANVLAQSGVVIGREQLNRMPATNLAQALQSIGGVHISNQYGGVAGSYGKVDIGGFGASSGQNTLILLNGRRLNTVDLSSVNLGSIPLSAIDRIEVLPASGAVLYGSGAVGGVVNVITRQHYGNHGRIEGVMGENNTRGGNVQGSFSAGNVDGMLSLGKLGSDNYRDNNATWQSHAFGDLRYVNDDLTLYLTTLADKQKTGLPGALPNRSSMFSPNDLDTPKATNTPDDWAKDKTVRVMPGASYRFNDQLTLHLDSGFRVREQESKYGLSAATKTHDRTLNISPRLTGQFDAGLTNRWTAGVDYYRTHYNHAHYNNFFAIDGQEAFTRDTQAVYFSDSLALTSSTWLTLGARHEWVKTDKDMAPRLDNDRQEVGMWSAGLRHNLNAVFSLFAKAERSARYATVDELAKGPLQTQTGKTYSMGAKWQDGGQYSILTLWQGKYHNELAYDPDAGRTPQPFDGANVNLDPTKRQGISLNSYWQLDKNLWLAISGTYQEAHFDGGVYADHNVPLVPRVTGYARIDWQPLDQIKLSLSERYQGKQYQDNDQANDFGQRIGSYHHMNVSATWQPTGAEGVYVTAALYNATNSEGDIDYAIASTSTPGAYSGYPLPGRYWLLKAGVNF